jgi:short-subunit dehydrogenase
MSHRDRFVVAGGVALVTGAAGGIGSAICADLASRGSHLALTDQNGSGLVAVANSLRARFPQLCITTYEGDVAERATPVQVTEQVIADHGRITLLVNNAGVALAGTYEQVSMSDVDWLLDINLRATMAFVTGTLPHLAAGSHITNISSLFGIIAPFGNAAYSASKFGVRGFSQALRTELKPRGIGVTTVFPGGIRTQIAAQARRGAGVSDEEWSEGQAIFERMLVIDPRKAAHRIVQGTLVRKPRVLIGPEAYLGDGLARIAPAASAPILEGLMRLKTRW